MQWNLLKIALDNELIILNHLINATETPLLVERRMLTPAKEIPLE